MADKGITRANLSEELINELDALTSGGSAIYPAGSTPTTVQFGAIPPGTDLSSKTLVDIIKLASTPYQLPDVSITSPNTLYEIGSNVPSIPLTIKVTKKSSPISSVTLYLGATVLTTFPDVSNGGTFNYTYSGGITTNSIFRVVANDGTNSQEKTLAITFVSPMYIGLGSGNLTKLVINKGTGYTYDNITCTNDTVVFKYPAAYGDLTSIKDPNNFENLAAFTKSTEVIGGVTYNVYTSGSATLSNFKYTFSF